VSIYQYANIEIVSKTLEDRMKSKRFLDIIIITVIFTACSSNKTIQDQPTSYPPPGKESQATLITDNLSGLPYPQFNEGDTIPENVLLGLLKSGSVIKITLDESKKVILFLKDGRTLTMIEPFENAIRNYLERCGDPCKETVFMEE
jgi:hypothetical protein